MTQLVVYEKRRCSTCRKLRELLAERGSEATYVEYQDVGISEARIRELLAEAGMSPREALRTREPLVAERGLDEEGRVTDDELIALMAEHPPLLQRPFVERGDRALLARPIERVLELLED